MKQRKKRTAEVPAWLHLQLREQGITYQDDHGLKHKPFKEALKGMKCNG